MQITECHLVNVKELLRNNYVKKNIRASPDSVCFPLGNMQRTQQLYINLNYSISCILHLFLLERSQHLCSQIIFADYPTILCTISNSIFPQ